MSACDVSVIIPAYNVEAYLEAAIRSALQNNRCSLEIIVINDGSTDTSASIAERMSAQDSRVRLISKENGGYGSSVNLGIKEAKGSYIAILEADDYVLANMYDKLFMLANMHAKDTSLPDVVKSSYWRVVNSGTSDEKLVHCHYWKRTRPHTQPFVIADAPALLWYHPSIWSALYRKDFLENCKIRFHEVPGAGWVDNPFWYETLIRAQSIVYTDEAWYCYREDLPSASSAKRTAAMSFARLSEMKDVVEAYANNNALIEDSLARVGLLFLQNASAQNELQDAQTRELVASVLARFSRSSIAKCSAVAPSVRSLALELMGDENTRISGFSYFTHLCGEFSYYVRGNGLGFALQGVRTALERNFSKR